MDKETLRIFTNDEIIAINQDLLGIQGHKVKCINSTAEVWAGPLNGSAVAVVLLNGGSEPITIEAKWSDIGLDSKLVGI